MNKEILRRLELLELRNVEPVKIFDLYRMPDGTEKKIRFKNDEQRQQWEAENGAELVDIIIEVKEGGYY